MSDPAHPHEKGEGAFYIWTAAELQQTLGPRDATIFGARFGVAETGNVDEDPHGEFTGRNILYQAMTEEDVARKYEWTIEDVHRTLAAAREVLMKKRSERVRPHLDDKVLTSWNAMMISAFAKGAQALGDPEYARVARRAADFLRAHLWNETDSILLRRFREGESAVEGFLDDYASLIAALLDLYETTFESADLAWAKQLAAIALAKFADPHEGGFYSTAEGQADLVLRLKDDYDGAEPSGNSVFTLALLRLARITGDESFRSAAERALQAFGSRLRTQGTAVPQMQVAFSFASARPMEIVFAGPPSEPMLSAVRQRFLPNAVILRAEDSTIEMPALQERSTAYVCENYACNQPVTEASDLEKLLPPTG